VTQIIPFRRRTPPSPVIDEPEVITITTGGIRSALNLRTPVVVKVGPARLARLMVISGGSSGSFVLCDCATLAEAAMNNVVYVLGSGEESGTVIDLDWPCASGIALSSVPDGGVVAVSFS
jgi:hypothetical protein